MKWAVVFVVVVATLGLVAMAPRHWWPRSAPPAVVTPPPRATSAAPSPTALVDPLAPDRPVNLDQVPRGEPADWIHARPAFQASRSPAERGGIEPCASQPVDTSAFEPWLRLSKGQLLVPRQGAWDDQGQFTLVIHLHGSDPVRRELVESGQHFVLYAITLDVNQSYAPLFAARGLDALVAEVEQALSKRAAKPARAGHVILSAWSAGFVGVEAVLAQAGGRQVDAAILIDGLHAPRNDPNAFQAQLEPFVRYAQRAARRDGFLFISHSSIDPPDFASTTECAHYLVSAVGGRPQAVRRADRFGLELVEYFEQGDLYVRGYAGNDKADHCAQLALLRDVYAALGKRWGARHTADSF
jgi:hypothetical protein